MRTTSRSHPALTSRISRRRLFRLISTAAAVGALGAAGCSAGGHRLVCQHQRSGEVYAEFGLTVGSLITHSWIHSIELSRWADTYRFDGEQLRLTSTEFEEYGAGMPLDEGDLRIEDGTVIIENIDREFDAIRWIHSHRADYRIGIDDNDDLIAAGELPDHEPIELRPQ